MGLWLALALPLHAQSDTAQTLFAQGQERAQAQDYKGALVLFRQALALSPDDPQIVLTAGMAANLSGDYRSGIELFTHYRRLQPADSRGLAKLIQAYQGAGQDAEAEKLVGELREMFMTGGVTGTMHDERSFVRDQFTAGKYLVMAFEFFDPDLKKREHTWDFVLLNKEGQQQGIIYVMRDAAAEEVSKGQQPYYFDVRWKAGGGSLLGVSVARPTYSQAARVVKRALAGEKVGPLIRP